VLRGRDYSHKGVIECEFKFAPFSCTKRRGYQQVCIFLFKKKHHTTTALLTIMTTAGQRRERVWRARF
jgi:hypothetical protein